MKKFRDLLFFIIAVLAFAACENELVDNNAITVTDGKSEYSINASGQDIGISFTTTDKWEAVVEDTSEESESVTPVWISLSQKSGDKAGEYSVTISVGKNSGKARSAVVSLICRETVKLIIIKQAGEDGGTVSPGKKKQAKELRFYASGQMYSAKMVNRKKGPKAVMTESKAASYQSIILKTDSKNRVTKATNEAQKIVMEFFYDDTIVTVNSIYDDGETITSVYKFKDGRITEALDKGNNDTFRYTSDGYLKEYKTQDFVIDGNSKPAFFDVFFDYSWANGCFTNLKNYSSGNIYGDFNDQHSFEYLSDVSGISNICLSNILIDCDIWSIYRLAGKSCDRLISKMVRNGETTTYNYTFDEDKAVKKVDIYNPTEGSTTIEIIY